MQIIYQWTALVLSTVSLVALYAVFPSALWFVIIIMTWIVFIIRNSPKKSQFVKEESSISPNNKTEPQLIITNPGTTLRVAYSIPPPPGEAAQKARWIPAGESVSIAGYTIDGGMIYVGSRLSGRYGQQDPSLIDSGKPVLKAEDSSGRLMTYWPSYSEISPQARGSYLLWLSTGRKDPDADVGYVFLFFYGLERRILVDASRDDTVESERPKIKSEIERLLSIYGKKSGSIQNYLSSFLQILNSRDFGQKLYTKIIPPLATTYELPFYLRLALGQAAIDGVPVPSFLALSWAMYDPLIAKRTPVTLCSDEFSILFPLKYKKYYNEGIKLPVNKTKLKLNYHPASSSLQGIETNIRAFGDIPDIAAVIGPQKRLQKIVDECADELDSYSRFLGRNIDKKNSIDALLLLPVSLWPDTARSVLTAIKEQVGDGFIILKVSELLNKFENAAELSKDKIIALAKALEYEQIGMEPDIISYPYSLKSDDSILIHIMKTGIPHIRTTPEYQTAVLTLQLASAVANSDGDVNTKELSFINEQIEKWQHLSEYHIKRLQIYLNLMIEKPLNLTSLKKRLENLHIEDRKTIVGFISSIALADGVVSHDEISFLEKVYKTLNVDVAGLYSLLHNGIKPTENIRKLAENGKTATITLDKARIESLRKDTENVSALLSSIFIEEMEKSVESINEENENMLGLDDAHAAFLRMLLGKPIWNRRELVDIAKDLDLMIDGAIETINEAAFAKYDQPVIEGDDPVEINMNIRKEVLV